jgi:two-component system OmpR family sensor kinase
MSRMTLTRVLVLTAAVVAVVALVAAALLTRPLVRTVTEDSARTALARQTDLLARLPGPRVATQLEQRADTRPVRRGLAVGVVTADGVAHGAALALPDASLTAALAGGRVSTTATWQDQRVLIESRPLRSGGSVVLASSMRDVDAAVTAQQRRLFLALAVGLVAALLAGAVVARHVGRPLAALAETARRLGSGERGVVPTSGGTREVAEVARALQALDAALQHSEDRQRRFLTSVSHELRTPLTAVRGYAESLVDGAVAPEEMEDVGRILVGESQRLEGFIDELLALSRLEADDFTLSWALTDLRDVARAAVDGWQDRAVRAGLRVESHLPDQPVTVETDAGRVRQVVDALIDNAVRACPEGAVVAVAVSPLADGARVEVRDSGPGLTPDDAAVAFEPGVLHDRYAGERPGGHGLGLAIVHRLVTRLGGTIRVEQAPEGGAAFVVDLPRTA